MSAVYDAVEFFSTRVLPARVSRGFALLVTTMVEFIYIPLENF